MTKKEFLKIIQAVKDNLIKFEGDLWTCCDLADEVSKAVTSFDKKYKFLDSYESYLDAHLVGTEVLTVRHNNKMDFSLSLIRRYIVLDSFAQEIVATKEYLKF